MKPSPLELRLAKALVRSHRWAGGWSALAEWYRRQKLREARVAIRFCAKEAEKAVAAEEKELMAGVGRLMRSKKETTR